MPDRPADLRRDYRLHLQIGAAFALLLTLAAFTVPTPEPEVPVVIAEVDVPVDLIDVVPTNPTPPPPPPPPAQPPPVEVSDDVVEQETVEALDINLEDFTVPSGPPAPPIAPPPPPKQIEAPPVVEDPIPETDEPFVAVEDPPVLIDGLAGLQSRVTYPEMARRIGIEGMVYITFVVEKNGSVTDLAVLRSPNDLLSEAALEAVAASRFIPGKQRGRAVRVRFTLPVKFVLR